jgi:5'-phosphate synthase pdxT subunit
MIEKIKKMAIPIMGTCAGCILLAEEIEPPYHNLRTLGLMSMSVCRNAFGRQRYSFETKLKIKGFKDYYQAVFIRAPVIKNVWDDCEVLAKFEDNIVAVR